MIENIDLVPTILTALAIGLVAYINEKDPFDKMVSALHLVQLEEYKVPAYMDWLRANPSKAFGAQKLIEDDKTPLVYTDRMKRLVDKNKKVNRLIYLILIILSILAQSNPLRIGLLIVSALPIYGQAFIVALSARLQEPEEKKINLGHYKNAQNKIRTYKEEENLKVLGITGSFGKTSTKFICSKILGQSFKVQDTPSSYNTPMGLSLVINNDLTRDKEVFIAEMGAYVEGEIKELTDLVYPDIGILTSIGPMHLETFGSMENIVKTKYELIEALPSYGIAIFNYDDPRLRPLADKEERKTLKYGLEDIDNLDVYATSIKTTREGSDFNLHIKGQGKISCQSKMLGRHNILNILAGASVGHAMGMDLKAIKAGISMTEPVDHRLSLIQGAGGTTIIDDAFNSNPSGAKAALDVLKEFEGGKKIIVTPGMIGLGDLEDQANYEFGKQIGQVCDLVYLVGPKRTRPIQRGLEDSGFDQDAIVLTSSLEEASTAFGPLLRPGDVILFENDLPDNYSEV